MQVFLDDEPYEFDESPSTTVGGVLQDVLRHARLQERVVASIRCDGVELDAENMERVLAEPVDKYARLDFASSTAGELAVDALARVQAMLMEAESTRAQAVEDLNRGRTTEAMALLRDYFEAWRQAHEVVLQSARLVGLDLTVMSSEGVPLAEFFARFAEQLRQLKLSLEAGDMVALADMLTYEADAMTQRWIEVIEEVKQASQGR